MSLLTMPLQFITSRQITKKKGLLSIMKNWDKSMVTRLLWINWHKVIQVFVFFNIFLISKIETMLILWYEKMDQFFTLILHSSLDQDLEECLLNQLLLKWPNNISNFLEDSNQMDLRNMNPLWSNILPSCYNAKKSFCGR